MSSSIQEPINQFWSSIQSKPYYLQNDLRNLRSENETAVHSYDSHPLAQWTTQIPLIAWEIPSDTSKVVLGRSLKTLIGVVDEPGKIFGKEYEYTLTGSLLFSIPASASTAGAFLLSFDLDNHRSFSSTNTPVYVSTDPNAPQDPCETTNQYIMAFIGSLQVGNQTIIMTNPIPYDGPPPCAPLNNTYYSIQGNRLYLLVGSTALGVLNGISYEINLRIIENLIPEQQ